MAGVYVSRVSRREIQEQVPWEIRSDGREMTDIDDELSVKNE